MKKLITLIYILIFSTTTLTFANEDYLVTDLIKVQDKTFVGFGGFNYYDMDSYKYNAQKDTYVVDIIEDRDPSTDLMYYSPSPYDDGIITHILLSIKYTPSKKKAKVKYKGFISSKEVLKYKNGVLHSMNNIPTYIYYDNNKKHIPELKMWLDYYNFTNIKKSHYHNEITKSIKTYIERAKQ